MFQLFNAKYGVACEDVFSSKLEAEKFLQGLEEERKILGGFIEGEYIIVRCRKPKEVKMSNARVKLRTGRESKAIRRLLYRGMDEEEAERLLGRYPGIINELNKGIV